MKKVFWTLSFCTLYTMQLLACSCSVAWNDSFSRTAKGAEFVALVKVISFDEFLDRDFMDLDEDIPYSMSVEVIEKYKGEETRSEIKIFGDNGILCRPYLSEFKLGGYYLAAPYALDNSDNPEYEFLICRTDYLEVDITSMKAYGKYSMFQRRISLEEFKINLENGDRFGFTMWSIGLLFIVAVMISVIKSRRRANTAPRT